MRCLAVIALLVCPVLAGDIGFDLENKSPDPTKNDVMHVKVSGTNMSMKSKDGLMLLKDGVLTMCNLANNTHIVMDDALLKKIKEMMAAQGMGGGAGGGGGDQAAYDKAKAEIDKRCEQIPEEHRERARQAMMRGIAHLKPKGATAKRKVTRSGTEEVDGKTYIKYVVTKGEPKVAELLVLERGDAGIYANAIDALQAWAKAMAKMPKSPMDDGSRDSINDFLKIGDAMLFIGRKFKDGKLDGTTSMKNGKEIETTEADFLPPKGSVRQDPFAGMGGGGMGPGGPGGGR